MMLVKEVRQALRDMPFDADIESRGLMTGTTVEDALRTIAGLDDEDVLCILGSDAEIGSIVYDPHRNVVAWQ